MKKNYLCVGLFGTCGNSTFRKEIMIPALNEAGIPYFNPQVENWTPECAEIESQHLVNDAVICFPVTGETYGTGSLAETGYSILTAINMAKNSRVIIYIEDDIDESLKSNPVAAKESLRSRILVKSKIEHLDLANVYFAHSIEHMTQLAIKLYGAAVIEAEARELEKI